MSKKNFQPKIVYDLFILLVLVVEVIHPYQNLHFFLSYYTLTLNFIIKYGINPPKIYTVIIISIKLKAKNSSPFSLLIFITDNANAY